MKKMKSMKGNFKAVKASVPDSDLEGEKVLVARDQIE